jgi:drug/metabolite transporter (DMT)-like permease
VIIIAVFTFIGAFGSLIQAVGGQPNVLFGIVVTGMASRLLALIVGIVQVAVGVGLVLMSRWGWWLAIILCLLGALGSFTAIPNGDVLIDIVMQNNPAPPPPEMMPLMQASFAVAMVFSALLQVAVIGYLLWRRDLFGIDVEPAALAEEFGGPTAGFQ